MDLPKLNLPSANLKTKLVKETTQVFDQVRKKYLVLTHEEWVRQHFISYLNKEKNYPYGLIGVEKMVKYNRMRTRADIVLYDNKGKPKIIVECKAPNIKITQDVFDQVAKYNFKLRVPFLIITNGINHFCCSINYVKKEISFLKNIPDFNYIISS